MSQRLRPNLPLLLALLVSLPVRPALAAWPHDPTFGNVALCTADGPQDVVAMVPDGAGGAIVVWQDLRTGVYYDIYANRVNAAGESLWGSGGVPICIANQNQDQPKVVADGAGGAIIVWQDSRNTHVFAQRVNAAGTPLWATDGIQVCPNSALESFPAIVSDGAGGAIIGWSDFRSGASDIYVQRIGPTGTALWSADAVPLCTAAGSQIWSAMVSDGQGGAVVAWGDQRSGVSYDIYARRVNASGVPQWIANGVALSTAANDQQLPQIVSDGMGGAIVAWRDFRSGQFDLYAQGVSYGGLVKWVSNGAAVCTAANDQAFFSIAPDGAAGAFLAWADFRGGANYDLYAQRLNSAGAAVWTSNGTAVCALPSDQAGVCITGDGVGGAILAWADGRSSSVDVYAQRISPSGLSQWAANGVALSTAYSTQQYVAIASDGAGGAIAAWIDSRNADSGTPNGTDIYAQRIDRYGMLGNPEPTIQSVKDVLNDQGGKVKVSWSASYLDADPTYGIFEYRLWRSVPQSTGAAAMRATSVTHDPDEAAAAGKWLVLPSSATDYAWELVGSQAASILPSYSLVASTTADSVPGSNPLTAFMVEARAGSAVNSNRWFSAAATGYSVDNLPPATPIPFTGTYGGGATALHWGASPEADFSVYRLHRGATPGFVPEPGNLIATSADTGYVDAAGSPQYYKLAAVDAHGNVSGYALLSPAGTVSAPADGVPVALALGRPEPNPARLGTRIDFELPRATHVSLAVHDLAGRLVRVLHRGPHAAGRFSLPWDLRDQDGSPTPSGMYFVRLEAEGRTLSRRVVSMR